MPFLDFSKPRIRVAIAAIFLFLALGPWLSSAHADASNNSNVSDGATTSDDQISAYGVPDSLKYEFSQLSYLRGHWVASIIMMSEAGEKIPLENRSEIVGFYHADGRTFQSCFRTKGFYSTDIRAYDEKTNEWRAHFINARAQRWSHFTIKKIGDQLITMVPGGFSGEENFDIKTIDRDFRDGHFIRDVFRSTDGGSSWIKTYEMTYTRSTENLSAVERC